MVFSSYLFLFYFLPVALLLYYAVPRRAQHLILTVVSFIFYGWANPLFSFLLLFSTLIDYVAGLVIALGGPGSWSRPIHRLDAGGPRVRRQRAALIISISANLTLLAFFKYFNFGVESYNGLVAWIGLPDAGLDVALRVALPLGISLYILQSLSYVIDVYRGDSTAIKSFNDFLCFEMMYPQLVAGPIIRYSEIEDQLQSRTSTPAKFARGIAFFSLGTGEEGAVGQPLRKNRRSRVRGRLAWSGRRVVRRDRVRVPDLLRFQRLLRHGDRPRPDARLRVPEELRLALPFAVSHRVLAPLAHLRCRRGCATICTCRSVETARAACART